MKTEVILGCVITGLLGVAGWLAYTAGPIDYDKVPRYAPNATQHIMVPCPPPCNEEQQQKIEQIAKRFEDKTIIKTGMSKH